MKKTLEIILVTNFLFLGTCGYAVYSYTKAPRMQEVHEFDERYSFINPLLECNPEYEYYNPGEIKKDIDTYIKSSIKSGNISDAAYYVRLLKNGSTFGYNQDAKFISASLVKLPLAIGLMRQISPGELGNKVTVTDSHDGGFFYDKPQDIIEVGKTYSIGELLSTMLIHSDNMAATSLLGYLNENKAIQTYQKFGLGLVDFESDNSLNMSVKSYASFFRALYNSSYLSRDDSEFLLSLLSQSTFIGGIRFHLPKDVVITNKFGTRNLPSGERHIHDCGNIYYSDEPYLLCVMTKGDNENSQLKVIRDISKMVFDDISTK